MNTRIVMLNAPMRSPGAFLSGITPTPTGATNGACRVLGAPGTHPVFSPRPAAIPPTVDPRTQDSRNAPTVIRPSLYIATPQCGRPPVPIRPENVSPTPATKPNLVAVPRMSKPKRIGGRTATRAARPLITWPTYGGGTS